MRARSTATEAMETEEEPIWVSVRTLLATEKARCSSGSSVSRSDGADFAGDGVGLLDLAEDLRLADDHGVERAGDAEEMADGLALAEFVEVRLDGGGGDGEVFVEEAEQGRSAVAARLASSCTVRSSTRLQVERMRASRMPGWWTSVRVASARRVGGDGEALADLDGRGGVVDAEERRGVLAWLATWASAHGVGEPVDGRELVGGPDGEDDEEDEAGEIDGAASAQAGVAADVDHRRCRRSTWRRRAGSWGRGSRRRRSGLRRRRSR